MGMPQEWLDRLFLKFSMVYRNRFTDWFEDEQTKQEWLSELDNVLIGIRPEWIKGALGEMMIQHPTFPPSLAEFRGMCLKFRPTETFQANALPAPSADSKKRLEELSKVISKPKDGLRNWAYSLKERHESGEDLHLIQIKLYQGALREPTKPV